MITRSGDLPTIDVSDMVEDMDFSPAQCYKDMCPRFITIVIEACRSPERMFLSIVADELDKQMQVSK